jgi:predicted O-methyltransferase YrrM
VRIQQNEEELGWLIREIKGSRSILEIGSCDGLSLRAMAGAAVKGAVIRSIELGVDDPDTAPHNLKVSIGEMCAEGYDAQVHFGNSRHAETIEWATQWQPYDFIFIDGDHSYEAVREDWENYGPIGVLVGFHDIANPNLGVKQLWDEITRTQATRQIVAHPGNMGIGLTW